MLDKAVSEDEQWASVSDLMAVLMLIFMFIAIVYLLDITPLVQEKQEQENSMDECNIIYGKLQDLENQFSKKFPKWEIQLKSDLTILFRHPDALFKQNDSNIGEEFGIILEEFYPNYIKSIFSYESNSHDDIREIRIEGHTSTEGPGKGHDPYIYNMQLSQNRAREILKHVLNLSNVKEEHEKWARPKIIANGLSSSKFICSKGQNDKCLKDDQGNDIEDKGSSRRVEFRLLTSSCQKAGVYDEN